MILVVGATGMVGSEVCRRATARGIALRAMVRPTCAPDRVEKLRRMGAEVVTGDLRDPASLRRACTGVDAVIATVSAMPFSYVAGVNDIETTDQAGMMALVDAARDAGVMRFVYTSFSRNLDLDFPLGRAKRTVEAHLRSSGIGYTILRPSFFSDVWLSPAIGFDPVNGKATIYGDGSRPISFIASGDVAEFAIRSLETPGTTNATIELGGPDALTPLEVVRTFEKVSGRPIAVERVLDIVLMARETAATDPMDRSFTALMRCYAKGDPIDMAGTLATMPVALTSVEDYAHSVMDRALVGAPS